VTVSTQRNQILFGVAVLGIINAARFAEVMDVELLSIFVDVFGLRY